jgi:hypothetical protein
VRGALGITIELMQVKAMAEKKIVSHPILGVLVVATVTSCFALLCPRPSLFKLFSLCEMFCVDSSD